MVEWPSQTPPSALWSPGRMDAADAFDGSDEESLSHDLTGASGGSVSLGASNEAFSHSVGGSTDVTGRTGFVFTAKAPVSSVSLSIGGAFSLSTVYVVENDTGSVIESTGASADSSVSFSDLDLQPDSTYRIVGDADGGSYTRPGENYGSIPFESEYVTVESGYDSGSTDDFIWLFESAAFTAAPLSGSATVSWPAPDDLAGWDIIPYQVTEDGGTVEVYAVDAADDSELLGPLEDPGDISDIPRDTNVAVRVDLSRTSTDQNPRADAVYRRYKV